MDLFLDNFVFVFGVIVNLILILNILIRPVLWSTTNTFICCLLASNLFYLAFQTVLSEAEENSTPDQNIIFHYLEHSFAENYRSMLCSAKYISQFLHGTIALTLLVGIIFIRSMMIKYADNIRTKDCKAHQALLSFIGILVAVFIFTSCTGVIITFIIHPLSTSEYVLVRNCMAVTIEYESTQYGMWLPDSVILVLLTVATLSCQVRVSSFRKRHNNSYFRKYRQNIATMNQLLVAAYLTLLTAIFKETIVLITVLNFSTPVSYEHFLKINSVVNCIIIPIYWMNSTKNDFKDFWLIQTCFWKTKRISHFNTNEVQMVPLEPRRPPVRKTDLTYEGTQLSEDATIPRRFCYGMKITTAKIN